MTKRRRILAVTGIRSEYFLQRSILRAIMQEPTLELQLVVTGAHLSPLHDYTVRNVEEDGFPIVGRVESLLFSDRDAGRLKGAALQLQVLSHLVDELRPDWLLAVGDREEALVLALCGTYMNIPTAHYGAGDRAVGNVDDIVRQAISRLSHLLLAISEESRHRLVAGGEAAARVHTVGHAGLDRIRTTPSLAPGALAARLGVPAIRTPYLVVVQHPVSSEAAEAGAQMRETLEAVKATGCQAFVSYPNSDAGSQEIIRVIHEFREDGHIHVFRNIPDELFVNLLRGASVLLGNSSLGLLEAPFLRLAAINVGHRQQTREHAENLQFVAAEREEIARALRKALFDPEAREAVRRCSNPFGDGETGIRVARLLATTPIDEKLLNKEWTV